MEPSRDLLSKLFERIHQGDKQHGKPFNYPDMINPHPGEVSPAWSHYGLMIPDLPPPFQFFNMVLIAGMPGVVCFDHEDMIKGTARNTATMIAASAAMDEHLFRSYSIEDECMMPSTGELVQVGGDLTIEGRYPQFQFALEHLDFDLRLKIQNTDKVSWFVKIPGIYTHVGILSRYEGTVANGGEELQVAGLCSFDYAYSIGLYGLFRKGLLPGFLKVPANYFVSFYIAIDETTQLLVGQIGSGDAMLLKHAYLKSLDDHGTIFRQVELLAREHQEVRTPDGVLMKVPTQWECHVKNDRQRIHIQGHWDTGFYYGLGRGFAGGFHYEGSLNGQEMAGRGYVEFIDRR